MIQSVIFDFDGTLADTSGGIIYCYNTAANMLGYPAAARTEFEGVIGGHVDAGFKRVFGMEQSAAAKATTLYRALYESDGMHKVRIYDGITDTLNRLRKDGMKISLATLKHEKFASRMLENLGILDYFDAVCAFNGNSDCDKEYLLHQSCRLLGIGEQSSVLIGDSAFDAAGAKAAGVRFIAVMYGLGFHEKNRPDIDLTDGIVDSADAIYQAVKAIK